ncbi:CACNA1G [Symbiodinium sp. KB8]|nr:CACNA1G [Symbiodinium sp. KB8]
MHVPAAEEEDESYRTEPGLTTHHVDSNEIGLPHEDRRTAQEIFTEPATASPSYDLHADIECQSLSPPEAFSAEEPEKPAAGEAANETHDLVPICRTASFCTPPGSCTTLGPLGAESEDSGLEETAAATQSQLTSGESDTLSATIEGFDFGHFETTPDIQADDSCIPDSANGEKCLQVCGEVSVCDEPIFEETTTMTQSTGDSDASTAAIEDFSHVGTTPDTQADDSCIDSADDVKGLQGLTEAPPSHQVDDEMTAATPRLAAAVPTRSPADPVGSGFLRAAASTAPGGSPRSRRRQSRIPGAARSQSESRSRRPALTDRCHRSGKEQRVGERMAITPKDLLSFDHSPAFADLGMKAREYAKEVRASHLVDMEPADTLAFPECRHVSLMAMLPAYAMKERRLPPPRGVNSGSEVSYNRGGWNPTRSEKFLTSARSARNADGGPTPGTKTSPLRLPPISPARGRMPVAAIPGPASPGSGILGLLAVRRSRSALREMR